MHRRLLLVALLVDAGVCGVALAQPPQPQARKAAAEHFGRGEAAQKAGRYRDAIAEYEEAHALVPHANALFNIAVCYEKLGEWSLSADYYERYLDDQGDGANDRGPVTEKIRELRAKSQPVPVPDRRQQPPERVAEPDAGVRRVDEPPITVAPPRSRWHLGGSYGIGIGDAPVERFLAYGGLRIAGRIELDAIGGKFGKNDLGVGVVAKLLLGPRATRGPVLAPYARGAATLGYAKQDASSTAETRLPIGLEAGGGIGFGWKGRFELGATVRWTSGGFDMTTSPDSYINDAFAVAIDLGILFDIPKVAASAAGR